VTKKIIIFDLPSLAFALFQTLNPTLHGQRSPVPIDHGHAGGGWLFLIMERK